MISALNWYWPVPVILGSLTVNWPPTRPRGVPRESEAGGVLTKRTPVQSPVASALAAAKATFLAPAGTTVVPPPVTGIRTAEVAVKSSLGASDEDPSTGGAALAPGMAGAVPSGDGLLVRV
jgi:hypothetical protein